MSSVPWVLPTPLDRLLTPTAQAVDRESLLRHAGRDDVVPLWIAEPYLPVAPEIVEAVRERVATEWFGYEVRAPSHTEVFWQWMARRHGWDGSDLLTSVSPSVGTTIGVLLDLVTAPGDGVIIQPPVFTDFKPLVVGRGRELRRAPLVAEDGEWVMDLDALAARAAAPDTTAMILCNPHNPVGRVWSVDELAAVATIAARHDVFVIADEIHADVVLTGHQFRPFATVVGDTGVRWAAAHGPIKTFGLAGLCDTLVVTADAGVAEGVQQRSSQLHLTRNNVLSLVAWQAAYGSDGGWVDDLILLVGANLAALREHLPAQVGVTGLEGTYLAWLDLRALGLDVPALASWLGEEARVATSLGHWFGREGAGFARLTIAAPTEVVIEAAERIADASRRLHG